MQIYPENIWVFYLIIAGFTLMGLIFLCIGIGLYFASKRKYSVCTQIVIATVIDIQKENINNSSSTEYEAKIASWFPIYEYVTNGITFRKKAFVGTAKPEVTVGEKVSIFINPNNPAEFSCPSEKRMLLQKIFMGVGIGLIVLALILGIIAFCAIR
jgi:hypothetical protein